MSYILLGVFTVPKEKRVYCQHPECTKTVYKEIHVVHTGDKYITLGSTCFDKFYSKNTRFSNKYASSTASQVLTQEERDKLVENTEEFLRSLPQPKPKEIPKPLPEQPKQTEPSDIDEEILSYCISKTRNRFLSMGHHPEERSNQHWFKSQYMMLYHHIMRTPKLLNKARSACSEQSER